MKKQVLKLHANTVVFAKVEKQINMMYIIQV